MRKENIRITLPAVCCAAVLGTEAALGLDLAFAWMGGTVSLALFAIVWLAVTVLAVFSLRCVRRILRTAVAVPVALAALAGAAFLGWLSFSGSAGYRNPDTQKEQIYADRSVMVVVPHQDDELNILGGVLEEYARYGSDIYPVFITNGDYMGMAERRYQEALTVFECMGVPGENVIFLGYGDEWSPEGPHLYNAQRGEVLHSHFGRTQTYGTSIHEAYREGRSYTIDHLMEDLKSVILEYRPDVIFCSDYDHHIDHKAATLLFDKVMGVLLKEEPEYRPVVYKAYAYSTAWEAEQDFYGENLNSTRDPFVSPYGQKPAVYHWEDRVRFPVAGDTLSRSLVGSKAYKTLSVYDSQGATVKAGAVINGDKVAWRRDTESLCLLAQIEAASGRPELLNDFMLLENTDLSDGSRMPYDGVWSPEGEDRSFTVKLAQPSQIYSIVLYDHPSEEANVLNAQISFDNGMKLETGPLDPGGAATRIRVDGEDVQSFTMTLLQTEGIGAGLTEVEAFAQPPKQDGCFLKLQDLQGNFVYDFRTAPDGRAAFEVYLHGVQKTEEYRLYSDNEACTAAMENGRIEIYCPAGESFTLTVEDTANQLADSVYIRNPGAAARWWSDLWQSVEESVYARHSGLFHKKLLVYQTAEKLSYVIRHGLG